MLKRTQMPAHKAPRVAAAERKLQALLSGDETARRGDAWRAIEQRLMHTSFDSRLTIGVERWRRLALLPPQRRRIVTCACWLEQARLACHARLEARQQPVRPCNRVLAV